MNKQDHGPHQDAADDWGAFGAAWRAQSASDADMHALRLDAARRGRRLRGLQAVEVLGLLIAVAMTARFVFDDPGLDASEAFVITLLAAALGSTAWATVVRARRGREAGLDAVSLVDLEIGRARDALRYWRTSSMIVAAMWIALCGVGLAHWAGWVAFAGGGRWLLAAAVNLPFVLATFGVERWRRRQLHTRLAKLQRLHDELHGA